MSEEGYQTRKERKKAEITNKKKQRSTGILKKRSLVKKIVIVCLVLGLVATGFGKPWGCH